jgi:hypothetical protein
VSESRYAAYLKKLQKQGNIGPALGGSEANQNNGSVNKVQDYDQVKGRP